MADEEVYSFVEDVVSGPVIELSLVSRSRTEPWKISKSNCVNWSLSKSWKAPLLNVEDMVEIRISAHAQTYVSISKI